MASSRDANSMDRAFLSQRVSEEAGILRSYRDKNRNGAALNLGPQLAKVRQLTAQLDKANAAGRAGSGPAPSALPLPQFLAPSGVGGKKGRTPKAPRDRSDDVTFQFDQELKRAQVDVLRAQQGMARTSEQRATIALQLLDAERQMQEAELNDRVRRAERDFAEGKITSGTLEQVRIQADKLRAEYDSVDALQRQAIAEDLKADQARDAAALADSATDLRLEQLQIEAALAETASERRAAELRILDLMKEQEKARLEAVIADQQSSKLAKDQAAQRLASLDGVYAGRKAGVIQGTRGPMENFQAEFGDISEELEQLKVQGIEGAVNALAGLTQGFENFRDLAVQAIQQVLQELIRLQLMKLAMNLIGAATGSPGGSLGGSSATTANSLAIANLGYASGGYTGRIPRNRIAGVVHGQEGVLNPGAMSTLGIPNLDILNRGGSLSQMVGNDNPPGGGVNIGSLHLPPGMTAREGRKTGLAIGRGIQERMAYTIRGRG